MFSARPASRLPVVVRESGRFQDPSGSALHGAKLEVVMPANRDDRVDNHIKKSIIRFPDLISRRSGVDCIIGSPFSTQTLMTEDGLQSTKVFVPNG
jgi:hypothetical protein